MFVHIGNGKSVLKKNVIGIFDLDTATVSKITKDFMNRKEKEGRVFYDDYDLPRAFVLSSESDEIKIRLSRISTLGLKQRINNEITEE